MMSTTDGRMRMNEPFGNNNSIVVLLYIQTVRRGWYEFGEVKDELAEPDQPAQESNFNRKVEFGVDDGRKVEKAHKARKSEAGVAERKRIKRVVYLENNQSALERRKGMRLERRMALNGPPASEEELAASRLLAKQAMLAAGPLARYCCGLIRDTDYECPINGDHGPTVLEVNSWVK